MDRNQEQHTKGCMTPQTIASLWQLDLDLSFSELLLLEAKKSGGLYHLEPAAPLFDIIHPGLIKALKDLAVSPKIQPPDFDLPDFPVNYFPDVETARNFAPGVQVSTGHPVAVGKLLNEKKLPVILDFMPLGAVLFSDREQTTLAAAGNPHQYLLAVWLNYATSPELWGEHGKWTKFHQRLHTLLSTKQLLQGQHYPGFYPLVQHACKLEKFGFSGKLANDSYSLTLPWSFPLTALVELEKIIIQEF